MELTLLRHAAVPKKFQNTYLGWSDVGIEEKLFDEDKACILKKTDFDLVISSDLIRCTQTIKKVGKTFTTDPRLREVKFKSHIEGKQFSDIEKMHSYDPLYLESEAAWHIFICEESQALFRKRLEDFLNTLAEDKKILICSHAGSIRLMMSILGKEVKTLKYLEHIKYNL